MNSLTQTAVRRLATLSLLLAAAPAVAQISLSSAVDLALRNDPRVKMAKANVAKAKAGLDEARDAFIPSVGVDGGYGKSTGAPLGLPTVFSLTAQSLVFNFSQRDNIRGAAQGLEAARLSLRDAQDQVTEDVAQTYTALAIAERRHAAMGTESGFAQRLEVIVAERLSAGQDTRIELLKARRTVANIHLADLLAEDQIANLSDHLSRLVGVPLSRTVTIAASIPPLPRAADLVANRPLSTSVQAAYANAQSKQEIAFGAGHNWFRPQVALSGNYSRIDTSESQSNFLDYYPDFRGKTNNNASIALQISIPLFDRAHDARSRSAEQEALHAFFEAESAKNQFLEGRAKLRHSAEELAARLEVAQLDQDLAQEQLAALLVQLSADSGAVDGPQMTPKDEQNARIQERQRFVDLLDAQADLTQATISLLRQDGKLDDWIRSRQSAAAVVATPVK